MFETQITFGISDFRAGEGGGDGFSGARYGHPAGSGAGGLAVENSRARGKTGDARLGAVYGVGTIRRHQRFPLRDHVKSVRHGMAGRSIGVVSLIAGTQSHYIWQQLTRELGLDLMERHQITCGDARMFQGKEPDIMFSRWWRLQARVG